MIHAPTTALADADIDPDALFVIACPICFREVAATARMAGSAASCPLCKGSFRVPMARLAEPPVPATAAKLPEPSEPATAGPPDAEFPPVAEPACPAIAEFEFHEPVQTVGAGAARIELRRLTDEERRLRRSRRNLMLLLVGAAVLIMIVVTLGIPAQRR